MSAYMHFMNGERERIMEENPAATFGELGKIAGAEWKSLADDDEKKLKYTKAAEEDKATAEGNLAVVEKELAEVAVAKEALAARAAAQAEPSPHSQLLAHAATPAHR